MKNLPPTYVVKNFLSIEEIKKIRLDVFENKHLWRSMLDYPIFSEKKQSFSSYKKFIKEILYKILEFNENKIDTNQSISLLINLIHQNYKNNTLENNLYFYDYTNDDTFMFFIINEAIKILKDSKIITDEIVENVYNNFFYKDKFQYMFGDAIYLISGKPQFINWNTQTILREKFNWVYDKIVIKFKEIFLEDEIRIHQSLPSPGFHIFSLFDLCEEYEMEYSYHEDVNILKYHPNINVNTIYSFAFLVDSPTCKPFVEFKDHKLYYEYGNLYLWKGSITHKIGKMSLKKGEHRITFQGHLFFDEKEKIVKMFF